MTINLRRRPHKLRDSSSLMDCLPLQDRVPVRNTLNRALDIFILTLLLSLLAYRLSSLREGHGTPWLLAFVCESWFTFVWLLNMNAKWNPVIYKTYPDRLTKRFDDLPAIDLFVTTADPNLEPPIIVVNTVLSLLAADYQASKLACYVSDDAASPITFYALSEASNFAKLWVPFCKMYNIGVRAPFVYFTQDPDPPSSDEFLRDWKHIKADYEGLSRRIQDASKKNSPLDWMDGDFSEFRNIERGNHESIVKVIWENKELDGGFPHLIYVAREKRPKHPHHYKAGAMNALIRVSGIMTNAPFMLNVDCDMFANNPKVLLHGMCLLLGFESEIYCGFVQTMQQFYGGLRDDPFGNQLVVLQQKIGIGIGGIQGPFYAGTGCFHRRKIMYGATPAHGETNVPKTNLKGELSYEELQRRFGKSKELIDSIDQLTSEENKEFPLLGGLSTRTKAAKEVSSCMYELNTNWGKEIGLVYGSTTEDVLTGLRIHSTGWRSTYLLPDPPAFLGDAPVGGPASLAQYKRWSTGLLEVLLSKNSPIIAVFTKHLLFRTCIAYHVILIWALRSVFELCYALLPAYCLLTGRAFLPDVSDVTAALLPISLFVSYNVYNLIEYKQCGLSARASWNNQRMQRITALTAYLFGFLSVVLKILGLSETVFVVTRKENGSDGMVDEESGRFTFDSSLVFVPVTAVVMVNLVALAGGLVRVTAGGGGGGAEFVCSAWVLACLWPFVKGLFEKGKYGIPWSVVWKAGVVASGFMQICRLHG